MQWVLTEDPLPDHPWDDAHQIEGWCETCGKGQILHDGNLDRVFDAMESASRKADEVWWYLA